ncbi:MAG: hypothetical protein COA45_07945 [Zetaproteobacteria bacterium]|nr:MAG: hypothetical protein COA45_07945 [Zetaproteobacteria bacterium]
MDRQQSHKNRQYFDDVIPAFLTPEHIQNQNDNATQHIIDIVDRNAASTPNNGLRTKDFIIRESLHSAIRHEHMTLFMQPIVSLPQRHLKFYEFYGRLRIKPGQYIPAQDYMALAGEEHIVNQIDTLLFTSCLKVIKKLQRRDRKASPCFINIKPYTLRERGFMTNLLQLLSRHPNIAHSLVFEMHYNDFLLLSPTEKKILDGLAQTGCRLSLDHVEEIPTDVKYLRAHHINFIKMETKILLRDGRSERGFSDLLQKKHNLEVNGIDIIAQKTENENEVKEILDFDIKYGQGFLFGRPDFQGVYTT